MGLFFILFLLLGLEIVLHPVSPLRAPPASSRPGSKEGLVLRHGFCFTENGRGKFLKRDGFMGNVQREWSICGESSVEVVDLWAEFLKSG